MNSGSLESFQVSCRCGWSPSAFQMRCTADWVSPTSLAIERVDQCVASFGVVSSVVTITSSTCPSVIVRGCPGRGSSDSPSRRYSANLPRRFAAMFRWTPNCSAISVLFRPSAAASTIRERCASARALVRRASTPQAAHAAHQSTQQQQAYLADTPNTRCRRINASRH